MTTGELIFVGLLIAWLVTCFYGIIFVDKNKTNWPVIIAFLFAPIMVVIAEACGLK